MADKIAPRPTALSKPYWEGCRQGVLRLQHCQDCERFQFYPRIICSHCGGERLQWRAASGRGQVASFTIVQRGISAAYTAPYVVALIDLEEGPRMMSTIVDAPADAVRIGTAVKAAFTTWSQDMVVPVFRLAEHSKGEVS